MSSTHTFTLKFSFLIPVRIDLGSFRFVRFISLRSVSIDLVLFRLDRSILIDSLRFVSSGIIRFVSLRSFDNSFVRSFVRVPFAFFSIN